MKIGIIGGTGALGAALATRLIRIGHEVCIGSRDSQKAQVFALGLAVGTSQAAVSGASLDEAAEASDIVFLTVPYSAHAETLSIIAPALKGKILVDATVPLRPPRVGTVMLPDSGSAAVEAATLLGPEVRVVSALQNIGAAKLGSQNSIDSEVLVAGDDTDAVEIVRDILAQIGLNSWHAGPLANSAAAEALTSVLIQINRRHKVDQAGIQITSSSSESHRAPEPRQISVSAVPGLKLFDAGDDLAAAIISNLQTPLKDGDVIVVAQKVVSKVENRRVELTSVIPSHEASVISRKCGKSPELVELIRQESDGFVRIVEGLIIARHKTGHILANAGIDYSNVDQAPGEAVVLWPTDPDESARQLRHQLESDSEVKLAVIISDSLGRPWRMGTTGSAIGVSGLKPITDRRGEKDLFGREMESTLVCVADEIAAAASLVIGECSEGLPVAIVRGANFIRDDDARSTDLLRPKDQDLFQ